MVTSKLMFIWWIFTADMFNVKSTTFTSFPLKLSDVSPKAYSLLDQIGRELNDHLAVPGDHLLWTPFAGEWYGNYDLTRCRYITDRADAVLLDELDLGGAEQAIEVEYRNYMKSGGERPGTVRGAEPDRDRT